MNITPLIDLITNGWTVTFPAFNRKRAFAVTATRGEEQYDGGWINEQMLEEALVRLCDLAKTEPQPDSEE
jgi:hypothetical protein